jgi:hypothetical protein
MNESRRKQRDGMGERVIESEETEPQKDVKKGENYSEINQSYSFRLLRY